MFAQVPVVVHKYANELDTPYGHYYASEIVWLIAILAIVAGYLIGTRKYSNRSLR